MMSVCAGPRLAPTPGSWSARQRRCGAVSVRGPRVVLAKVCAESSESGSEKAVDAVAPLQRLTQRINQGGVETFQRLTLLKREQDLAVAEENYKRAGELRDTYNEILNKMSERQQAMAVTVSRLSSKDAVERKSAATLLGEIGDASCIPAMAFVLTDTNTDVHKAVEEAVWKLFMRSGNAEVDARMQQGMQAMMAHPTGLEKAKELFTNVVELAPDFAEGYNKRATVHYLQKDFAASIADCERVVELQPLHFGALSGAGLCFVGLQDYPSALAWFRRALSVNPGMAQIRHYDRILRSALAVQEEAKAKADALRRKGAEDGTGNGGAPPAPPSTS